MSGEDESMAVAVKTVLSTISYTYLGPHLLDGQHLSPGYSKWKSAHFEEWERERAELRHSLKTWGRPWITSNREGVKIPDLTKIPPKYHVHVWTRFLAATLASRTVLPTEARERDCMRSEYADALIPMFSVLHNERKRRLDAETERGEDIHIVPLTDEEIEAQGLDVHSLAAHSDMLTDLSSEDRALLLLYTAFHRDPNYITAKLGRDLNWKRVRLHRIRESIRPSDRFEALEHAKDAVEAAFLAESRRPDPRTGATYHTVGKSRERSRLFTTRREFSDPQSLIRMHEGFENYTLGVRRLGRGYVYDRLEMQETKRDVLDRLEEMISEGEQDSPALLRLTGDMYRCPPPGRLPDLDLLNGPDRRNVEEMYFVKQNGHPPVAPIFYGDWRISPFACYPNGDGHPEVWYMARNGGRPTVYARTPQRLIEKLKEPSYAR